MSVPAVTLKVNYRQYTEIALKSLKKELEKKGVTIAAGGPKEIKLAVVDLKMIVMPGRSTCVLNYTVMTGDGYIRGMESTGASWNSRVAIDMAVANVTVGVLNDQRILDYLEK